MSKTKTPARDDIAAAKKALRKRTFLSIEEKRAAYEALSQMSLDWWFDLVENRESRGTGAAQASHAEAEAKLVALDERAANGTADKPVRIVLAFDAGE